jgi:hypothetical protein
LPIAYDPSVIKAEQLYESQGSRKTGEIEEGEIVSSLKLL